MPCQEFLRYHTQREQSQWDVETTVERFARSLAVEAVTVHVKTIVLVHVKAVKAIAMEIAWAIAKRPVKALAKIHVVAVVLIHVLVVQKFKVQWN